MVDKPKFVVASGRDRPASEGRGYFLARFFVFFLCVISSRVLTGIASIRRASSSSETGVCSFACRALFMVESHHG